MVWTKKRLDGWKALTERLGGKVQLVGDDFFVANTAYLEKGIAEHALLNPYQS